jgi:hypothetical protein
MAEFKTDARTQDAPTLLRSAARLIERALIQLDVQESRCVTCGIKRFTNLTHAKAYQQLTDQPDKLTRTADALEGLDESLVKGVGKRVGEARRRNRARTDEESSAHVVDTTAESLGVTRKRP